MRILFKTALKCFGATLAGLCAAAAMAGSPVYHIEPLDNHRGLRPQGATAINNRGDVAGHAEVAGSWQYVAYRIHKGKLRALPGGEGAGASGMSKKGDIVGRHILDSHIWYADGGHVFLEQMWMWGINSAGIAVGEIFATDEAVVYDHGTFTRLGKLPGGAQSWASGVNDAGVVVGTSYLDGYKANHAFIWKGGELIDLGTLGGKSSWGSAINAKGHVTGSADKGHDKSPAFIYDGTTMRAVPDTAGGINFIAVNGFNNHDEIVGPGDAGGPLLHARNGKTYLLRELLDDSRWEWDEISTADAINDKGEIVGVGIRNGHYRAYIATPVSR